MAQLAIANTFLPQYAALETKVRRLVDRAIEKFAQHTHAGLHLEKINHSKDPRVRTIRIDDYWRGVVLAPDKGDVHCLLAVLGHDEAIRFTKSRRFSVNQALGVLESRDDEALESLEPALQAASSSTEQRLFGHVRDRELTRLGIDRDVLPIVRLMTTETHLAALERLLPEPQFIALLALAQGMTVEQAWDEVAACLPENTEPEQVDPDDLVTAMRRTPGQVVFVDGPDELRDILAHPFDAWRIFMHPAQRKVALRPSFNGPAQVTGGAGTGKTVTALHRARFLAQRNPKARILLTTFTSNLVKTLEHQLSLLVDDEEVRGRITVSTVDSVAYAIVQTNDGPTPANAELLGPLWEKAADGIPFSAAFLDREWEQVILAQALTTQEDYLACTRHGRGVPLAKTQRSVVWKAIAQVVDGLRAAEKATFHQLANLAAELVEGPRYDHVIVDEAQDLHPAQWRLLRRLVPAEPDDLFIVGDPHQRIYDNHVSLSSLGINVRGRSTRLKVNYRTTQEVLTWAVPVLGPDPAQGLDDSADFLTGYRSPIHGRRPVVRAYADRDAELDGLVQQIHQWLNAGVEPSAIGVAARANFLTKKISERLKSTGITAYRMPSRSAGVQVGTMHGMKGLEFRCVAVIAADETVVPPPRAITPLAEDPRAHAQDLQKERCLLFVACTRARDHLYVSYAGSPSRFLPA